MTIQQLLAQCDLEDIVRTTMTVYEMEEECYQAIYDDYAKFIETLLQCKAIPSEKVLLGIIYEDEGQSLLNTTVYHSDQLARGTPCDAIFEAPPTSMSADDLNASVTTEGWPKGYGYLFVSRAEVMGYQVNEVNLEDVGAIPLLVEVLYELTFFGFEEADMEAERHILYESIAEAEAAQALTPEEQAQLRFGEHLDIDALWAECGLPPRSPEEKVLEHQAMALEVFRNKQRTYHALRKYGGAIDTFETGDTIANDDSKLF